MVNLAFPEDLKSMKVGDLDGRQTETLYDALEALCADETLDSQRSLAFLADRYASEKAKGHQANSKALALIESLVFQPETLHGIKVGELGQRKTEALYSALEKLQLDATLQGDRSLAFLAEAYVAEKAKGERANHLAMRLIESIASHRLRKK